MVNWHDGKSPWEMQSTKTLIVVFALALPWCCDSFFLTQPKELIVSTTPTYRNTAHCNNNFSNEVQFFGNARTRRDTILCSTSGVSNAHVMKIENTGKIITANSSSLSSPYNVVRVHTPSSPSSALSNVAKWHGERRKTMIAKYGKDIADLERHSSSQNIAVPLLILVNVGLTVLSIWSGRHFSLWGVFLLALFPGSILSLWQLQILHDCLHGSMFHEKVGTTKETLVLGMNRKELQDRALFWGSMPSFFGYYLYLKYGHMSHHKNVGNESKVSLKQVFASRDKDFEDGDVLFVAHRMHLKGDVGPRLRFPSWLRKNPSRRNKDKNDEEVEMSISKTGFRLWKVGQPIRNASVFATSFTLERIMLFLNDFIVSLSGKNYFFPNKPMEFHKECAFYCRCALMVRLFVLWMGGSWKSWLFLLLSETLWSIPPHPACAMFITNHGSKIDNTFGGEQCIPSSSTYAGNWYSMLTLGTNYHCEHHDFPSIPFHKLWKLRHIAPEFYPNCGPPLDNVFRIMKDAFSRPEYYACMDAGVGTILEFRTL